MTSVTLTAKIPSHHHQLDSSSMNNTSPTEIDAARALLDVSPPTHRQNDNDDSHNNSFLYEDSSTSRSRAPLAATPTTGVSTAVSTTNDSAYAPTLSSSGDDSHVEVTEAGGEPAQRRPRSDSAGLDALAELAFREDTSSTVPTGPPSGNNNVEHSNEMTASSSSRRSTNNINNRPPAPFLVTPASSSSSEDDDHATVTTLPKPVKQDVEATNNSDNAYPQVNNNDDIAIMPPPPARRRRSASNPEGMEKWDSYRDDECRRHFVLPASILEVELAEASAAVQEQQQQQQHNQQQQRHCRGILFIPEDAELFGCEHDEEDEDEENEPHKRNRSRRGKGHKTRSSEPEDDDEDEDDDEEDELVVDEKDLSPEELLQRARSRLLEDLSESNVNGEKGVLLLPHSLAKYKEVYNKNGRIGIYTPAERAAIISKFKGKRSRRVWNKKIRYNCRKSLADRRLRVKGRFVKRSEQEQLAKQLAAEKEAKEREERKQREREEAEKENTTRNDDHDEDMPDIDDPEAGFVPTEDQPYRRLRRHTIT